MQERGWIEPIVERVVGQVLDSHVAQLRAEIVRRVMEEVAAAPVDVPTQITPSASGSADLVRAVAEIQLGASQKEILRALLDTSSRYAARVALFVVKGSHATGWQARGFANNDGVKDFSLDESSPAILRTIDRAGRGSAERAAANVPVAEWDSRFLKEVGVPTSGECQVLPLILKDKVAALVYADRGTGEAGLLDSGSLELLVLATSSWLEVNSLRKQALKEPAAAPAGSHGAADAPGFAAPAPAAPAFNDPFASHAPAFASGHAKAAAASTGEHAAASSYSEMQAAVVEMEPVVATTPVGHVDTAAAPQTPLPAMSPVDRDVHNKAQRFARLLVDEIKLYNQAKVTEGRNHKDLYDRLKEVIEKSRVTYHKRYGNTVASSAHYFDREIIRNLAEDDLSLMGANFRQ